ncbi:MAG: hypothetical protein BWY22_00978 [Bacteroidetes bacterium ADurb.Bin217]|nr:MAG: hypothetical protein BWY22_00978 [Bacteroidetes bacterium ADurb.Bin217]
MKFQLIHEDYILSLCDNDIEFINRLYQSYLEQTADLEQKLRQCILQYDYAQAKRIIHTLKSSFSVLGVTSCNAEIALSESETFHTLSHTDFSEVIEKIIAVYIQASQEFSIFIQNLLKS